MSKQDLIEACCDLDSALDYLRYAADFGVREALYIAEQVRQLRDKIDQQIKEMNHV